MQYNGGGLSYLSAEPAYFLLGVLLQVLCTGRGVAPGGMALPVAEGEVPPRPPAGRGYVARGVDAAPESGLAGFCNRSLMIPAPNAPKSFFMGISAPPGFDVFALHFNKG